MSEFIHRTEIAALKQSNVKLNQVISNLEAELHDLKCELERPRREDSDEKKQLKERIPEFEHSEAELKERMSVITRKAKRNNKKQVVKQLLSTLQVEDTAIVEAAIEKYYKKKEVPKIIIAFLFGVLCPLVVWWIAIYSENDKFYNSIIEHISKIVDYIK